MCNVVLSLDTLITIGKGHPGLVVVLNNLIIHAYSAALTLCMLQSIQFEFLQRTYVQFAKFLPSSIASQELSRVARDAIMYQVLKHVIMSDNAH